MLENGQTQQTSARIRGRPRDEGARKRILQAALEMLEEFGFANTTAEAIAQRAGTSKATLYRWWPGKCAVVIEALQDAFPTDLPSPDTGDLQEDIRLQLRDFSKLLAGGGGRIFRAWIIAAQADPEIAESLQTIWYEPRRRALRVAFQRHRMVLRGDLDLDVVLDAMYGPLHYRLLVGGDTLAAEYADTLTDIVVRGVARR